MDPELEGQNGRSKALKVQKPPLICSTRLTLAVICMFATWNFMLQRLTINFGLVCMVKRPIYPISVINSTSGSSAELQQFGREAVEAFENVSDSIISSISSISLKWNESSGGLEDPEEYCRLHSIAGKNKNSSDSSKFEDGVFEWPREVQGAILASFYYGFVFSQIPGGWLSDRFGAKRGLLMSGLLISILSLLTPMSAHMGTEWIFTLRLLQGIVNGAAMPAISILSSRWFPDVERGLMLGTAYAGFGLASATTYPVSAFFCEYTGWPFIFYFGGVIGLIWCVVSFFLVFDWPENHPRISGQELQFIQKHRAVQYGGPQREKLRVPWVQMFLSLPVWALLIANFCCFWSFLTISMYLPTYLKEVLYLDISENGLLSALPFVGMMFSHFLVAVCFDKLRKRNLCELTLLRKIFNTLGSFASGASMVAIGFFSCDNALGAVFMITLGQVFLEFSFMGGYIFSIFEMAPKLAGNLTASMNTFGLLVGFLSPALVSYLTPNGSREEWLLVFYIAAGINVFGGLFYLIFGSSKLQPWAVSVGQNGCNKSISVDKLDKELKVLKIKLINGESNLNGQVVKS